MFTIVVFTPSHHDLENGNIFNGRLNIQRDIHVTGHRYIIQSYTPSISMSGNHVRFSENFLHHTFVKKLRNLKVPKKVPNKESLLIFKKPITQLQELRSFGSTVVHLSICPLFYKKIYILIYRYLTLDLL